uniref:Uncharacterized protein n=1 Tax=Anguilla anguilla TaxID=7936 RepID=A0A0E9QQD7_ANGAN
MCLHMDSVCKGIKVNPCCFVMVISHLWFLKCYLFSCVFGLAFKQNCVNTVFQF